MRIEFQIGRLGHSKWTRSDHLKPRIYNRQVEPNIQWSTPPMATVRAAYLPAGAILLNVIALPSALTCPVALTVLPAFFSKPAKF